MRGTILRLVAASCALASLAHADERPRTKRYVLSAGLPLQTIDGFGVNVTPAQWRGGNLKPALDRLVHELGADLIRLDCMGLADWLDPARRNARGRFPDAYLEQVYRSPAFRDCWATFRHLASKGARPWLNVSGRVPPALAGADGKTLVDYAGYAEMVVSLAEWARKKEGLKLTTFEPFNETDFGPPEGPRIPDRGLVPATLAVLRRLDEAGMSDVLLVLPSDTHVILPRIEALANEPALVGRVAAFGTHTYGDGGDQEVSSWWKNDTAEAQMVKVIANSPAKRAPAWMTEYGDLDQTGEVEFGVAWRSTRRLLKCLRDGFAGAMAWDAFDNHHEHDAAWATYGLLATDRTRWTYAPKRRFFAAKQVYRYVRSGWRRVALDGPPLDAGDVYAAWHDAGKHVLALAFVSPTKDAFTVVGASTVEGGFVLELALDGLPPAALDRPVHYVRTSPGEDARLVETTAAKGGVVRVTVPEHSIFTITSLP